MTLLTYQVLKTVAEQGSFRKAADLLGLTPSAISHAISSLETELGFSVLNRSKNGVTLTNYGERLLPYVNAVLNSDESLQQAIAEFNGLKQGKVKVGCFSSVCTNWLPELMHSFEEEYPGIRIEIFQGTYDDVVYWIKNGVVDLGFLSVSSAGKIPIEPLYRDRLMCVVPKGFKTVNQGFVTVEELKGTDFVQPAENCDADSQILFEHCGFEAQSTCHVVDDLSILTMVQSGFGVCILPRMTVEAYNANVDVYPIFPEAYRVIGISIFESSKNSLAVQKLYEMIVDIFKENDMMM